MAAPPTPLAAREVDVSGPAVNRCYQCGAYAWHGYAPPGSPRDGEWPGPIVWACGTHRAEAEANWQRAIDARTAQQIAPAAQGSLL